MSDIRTARWQYAGDPVALPVQRCCEPGRRFGWVIVPKAHLCRVHFLVRSPMPVRWPPTLDVEQAEVLSTDINWHTSQPFPAVPYECPQNPGRYHLTIALQLTRLAVSSGDHPIETWRKVAGFTEQTTRPPRL